MIPKAQQETMLENGRSSEENGGRLHRLPVVRIVSLDTGAEWLLSEISPQNHALAFGAFLPSDGSMPLLGYVSIPELVYNRSRAGRLLDIDLDFRPTREISAVAPEIRFVGKIPSRP
ncbi:DUF2958 domain-containing protein [Mesorhizobium sp. ESP7-2]|uniref:DUF2958 domain-containing protein n=1 Tax=Mesorhizobium sp. ESP7-2 TaxID=2876622 RepID=UPI001CCC03F7|nr:DUF2958 domain-containing protein [Mesorhizobium sp. ESP7-2]MBZ9705347.1 DUF2958 domain-containing protein [Mesorhizobium sp. ESP7-2]